MVIIRITGNFLGMSVTTDNVRPSAKPNQWQIGKLTFGALCFGHLLSRFLYRRSAGRAYRLRLNIGALQTFAMVAPVFAGEARLYPARERPTFVEIRSRHSDGIARHPLPI
jgi:H+-transporting ATPase